MRLTWIPFYALTMFFQLLRQLLYGGKGKQNDFTFEKYGILYELCFAIFFFIADSFLFIFNIPLVSWNPFFKNQFICSNQIKFLYQCITLHSF